MTQLTLPHSPVIASPPSDIAPRAGPLAYLDQPSENHRFLATVALGGLATWAISVILAAGM